MTKPATTCAAGPTTPTCSGGTPTRSSSSAPGRIRAPACRAITWSPSSRRRWGGCSPRCAASAGCSCRGPGRTAAPRSASRSSTTTGVTVPAWDRARRSGGARCSSMTRRHGCVTTVACGGWTPVTPSAGSARRPARVTSAMGRCGSPGPTRWDGQAWTRRHHRRRRAAGYRGPDHRAGRSSSPPSTAELDDRGDELRRARAGIRALSGTGVRRDPAALAALETSLRQVRVRRQALAEEREALARAAVHGLPQEDPHAHLRHRALPNVDPARTRTRVLRMWSAVSASVLLTGLALVDPRPFRRAAPGRRRSGGGDAVRGSVRPGPSGAVRRGAARLCRRQPQRHGWPPGRPWATGDRLSPSCSSWPPPPCCSPASATSSPSAEPAVLAIFLERSLFRGRPQYRRATVPA